MRKMFIFISIIIVISILIVLNITPKSNNQITVGFIVPMEHKAMDEIVQGFKEQLPQDKNIKVIIKNAVGDLNIQKAIINQYVNNNTDYLVPIGLAATEMTIKNAPQSNIISLAADIKNDSITGVLDEIPAIKKLELLQNYFRNLHYITLIYSSAEKIHKETQMIEEYCKEHGITLQKLMIKDLAELYNVSHTISDKSQAILILKDHLIVSGIQALSKAASSKHIPIITSDEGSIKDGGAFALGVKEKSIGTNGALLLTELINGKDIRTIPMKVIDDLVIFYNNNACNLQNIDINKLQEAAHKLKYKLEAVQ